MDQVSGSPFWSAGPSQMLGLLYGASRLPNFTREQGTCRLSSAGPPLQAVGAQSVQQDHSRTPI